jgi:hypothetical protein
MRLTHRARLASTDDYRMIDAFPSGLAGIEAREIQGVAAQVRPLQADTVSATEGKGRAIAHALPAVQPEMQHERSLILDD